MESKIQKPRQSNRKGEVAEGLPGSPKERGMCEEKHQRTWETLLVPRLQRGKQTDKLGELMTSWESDQLIVLRERESRSQGEGADVIRSQQRKH